MIKQNKHGYVSIIIRLDKIRLSTKAGHSKNSAASDAFDFRGQQSVPWQG